MIRLKVKEIAQSKGISQLRLGRILRCFKDIP